VKSDSKPEYRGPKHDFEFVHHDTYYSNRQHDEEDYYPRPTYVNKYKQEVPVPQSIPEYTTVDGQRRRLTQFDRARMAANKHGGSTVGEELTKYQEERS